MMSRYIRDYGGNNYKRPYRVRRKADNLRSYRCLDCGVLWYLSHKAAARAGGVHCTQCGGPGEETEPSIKRRLGVTKREVSRLANSECESRLPYMCRVCHKGFRSSAGLKLHMEERHGRVDDF